jgi:ADP-ribosylglycohydrolase
MNTDKLTTFFALIFASDLMKNAIQKILMTGFDADSVGDLVGAVAAALWGYFTNKKGTPAPTG